MSKEKQIEEMAKIFCGMKNGCDGCMWDKVHCNERNCAEEIYNAGYRKQSEGEWKVTRTAKRIYIKCLCCNYTKLFDRLESITDERRYILDDFFKEHRFCPNCGAKMKGGAEG